MWRDIKGFEGLYQVSDAGHVRNARTEYVLKPRPDADGYQLVSLWSGSPTKKTDCKVHRLVAGAFHSNPDKKPEVNHLDGRRDNNVASNLEWATCSENHLHAYRELGREGPNQRAVIATATTKSLEFKSLSEAARSGFTRSAIQYCLNGQWKQHKGYVWRYAQ